MRIWWLLVALFLCAVLAQLNTWAIEEHIFWVFVWFDVFMHFLGGLALGVLGVGLLKERRVVLFAVGLAVAFVAWEVVEYVWGVPREANYALDTSIDFVMDTLGALVAFGVARRTIWKKK